MVLLFVLFLLGAVLLDFFSLCSFIGWCCVSPLLLRGAAWFLSSLGGFAVFPSPFGGVVFLLLLWVGLLFHLSSVGWCCLLSAHDEQWDVIVGEVEKMGKRVINEAELKKIQSKLTMESNVTNKCTKILYTTLLQHTKATPE